MVPFDASKARTGAVLNDIDAASLQSSKQVLEQWRIDIQADLLAKNVRRGTIIEVNRDGAILSGHHGARAAAEMGLPVDVLVRDLPVPSHGQILTIPVVQNLQP